MAYKRVAFLQPDVVFDSSGLASLVEVNTNGYMIGNLHKAPSSLPHPPPLPARPAVPAQLRDSRAASGVQQLEAGHVPCILGRTFSRCTTSSAQLCG